MAANKRQSLEDDIISHYGSITGDTFASRRSRRNCSVQANKVDLLARTLKDYHTKQEPGTGERLDGIKLATSGEDQNRFNKSFHHYRFLVVMMGGFSVGLMLLMRYSLTVSILRMVNQTHLYLEEHPNKTIDDLLAEGYSLGGEFNWNHEIVAIILSWYMFTYTLPQMPAARLSVKLGCRLSVPLSLSLVAISCILTPYFSYWGWQYVVVLRLLNGLGASPILPMLLNLVETWIRYDEISLGLSFAQTLSAGIVTVTPLIAGYLTNIHWKYAFYVPGFFTLFFCLLWYLLISDSPETNKFISAKELAYLRQLDAPKSGASDVEEERDDSIAGNKVVTTSEDELEYRPDSWLQIFRVPSLYAYIIMWCCYCSSFSGFTFILPTYLRQYLKIKVVQNGFYCFVVQTGSIVSVLWPHPLLRFLQGFGLSVTRSRIIAHAILCSMVASTWIYVGTFHDSQIQLLFLNRCFHMGNDIVVTGSLMSNYAKAGMSSLAFSLVNTIGNLSVVFSSTLVGWILDYTGQSDTGWRWIYTGFGASQILMFIMFSTFITSDPIKFKNKRRNGASKPSQQADLEAVAEPEPTRQGQMSRAQKEANNFDSMKGACGEERRKDSLKRD